jgi:hypothetical protein
LPSRASGVRPLDADGTLHGTGRRTVRIPLRSQRYPRRPQWGFSIGHPQGKPRHFPYSPSQSTSDALNTGPCLQTCPVVSVGHFAGADQAGAHAAAPFRASWIPGRGPPRRLPPGPPPGAWSRSAGRTAEYFLAGEGGLYLGADLVPARPGFRRRWSRDRLGGLAQIGQQHGVFSVPEAEEGVTAFPARSARRKAEGGRQSPRRPEAAFPRKWFETVAQGAQQIQLFALPPSGKPLRCPPAYFKHEAQAFPIHVAHETGAALARCFPRTGRARNGRAGPALPAVRHRAGESRRRCEAFGPQDGAQLWMGMAEPPLNDGNIPADSRPAWRSRRRGRRLIVFAVPPVFCQAHMMEAGGVDHGAPAVFVEGVAHVSAVRPGRVARDEGKRSVPAGGAARAGRRGKVAPTTAPVRL